MSPDAFDVLRLRPRVGRAAVGGRQEIAEEHEAAHGDVGGRDLLDAHAELLALRRDRDDAQEERVTAGGLEPCAHDPCSGILRAAARARSSGAFDEIEVAGARERRALIRDVEREAEILDGVAQRDVELLRACREGAVRRRGLVQRGLSGIVTGRGQRWPHDD